MGIFGGVQVFTILCSLIRTKLLAIWVGPVGVGLFAIFNSVIDMIYSATSLNIRNSSVRDIVSENDKTLKERIIFAVRRWSWIVGIFGAFVMLILSPLLSKWSFGNFDYTWAFIILSIVFVFNSFAEGEKAVMQGTNKLTALGKGTIVGTGLGVLVSVPLFYYWREQSIVPALIAFSFSTVIGMWWFGKRKSPKSQVKLNLNETIKTGKSFVKLGIYMTISIFISYLFSYLFIVYLNSNADTQLVGFFQSGNTLVDKYAGLLFTAMAMEYYPRLSQGIHSKKRTSIFVTQQINLTLIILLPIIILFLTFREFIVHILYSSDFDAIIPYISVAIIGTVFRTISWSMAFVILAKGNGKVYVITESLSAVTSFALNILMYHNFGLIGIGYSYILNFIIYCFIVGAFYRFKYKLSIKASTWGITAIVTLMGCACLLAVVYGKTLIITAIAVISIAISAIMLRKYLASHRHSR